MTREELQLKYRHLLEQCFDFSPSSGWVDLVDELFGEIERRWPSVSVQQTKSKYASLRVYVGPAPRECHDLIDEYERRSEAICETCGALGRQCGKYWLVVACPAHEPKGAA